MLIRNSIGTSALSMLLVATAALAAPPVSTVETASNKGGEPPVKPLAFVICAFEGDNAGQKCAELGDPPTYTVPSNRTFIIEQVTGSCSFVSSTEILAALDLNVVTNGVQVAHLLVGSKPEGTTLALLVSDDTHIYADRGSTITVGVNDDRFCRLAFSGRLVR